MPKARAAKKKAPSKTADDVVERLRIALGSDHEGYRLKEQLAAALREERHAVKDHGVHGKDSADSADVAEIVGGSVVAGDADLGILVCGSGAVASMVANKIPGVRGTHCQDTFTARQCRRTVRANVLCLGARVLGDELAAEIVRAWIETDFSGEERHQRLIDKVEVLEDGFNARRESLVESRVLQEA